MSAECYDCGCDLYHDGTCPRCSVLVVLREVYEDQGLMFYLEGKDDEYGGYHQDIGSRYPVLWLAGFCGKLRDSLYPGKTQGGNSNARNQGLSRWPVAFTKHVLHQD